MKQRLISLDKLKEYPIRLDHYDKENGSKQFVYGVESVLEYADYLPTVEAIPVEWIKKWLNNIANNERYKNECVELTEEVKRIVYKQTMIINLPCISDMLEDWEKENE